MEVAVTIITLRIREISINTISITVRYSILYLP